MKKTKFTIQLFAAGLVFLWWCARPVYAQTATAPTRAEIENIVREYLIKNPSVIREALQALEAQEAAEKSRLAAQRLTSLTTEIYADPDSPVAGNAAADISVVVFFDYFCGYCRKSLPALPALLAQDPSLRIIYKELPIMGPASQTASLAALAAGRQGKYVEFQQALVTARDTEEPTLKEIAHRLGLNYAQLHKDMSDAKLGEALARNHQLAAALEIGGTPCYVVGGQIIPGAVDADTLTRIIAAERAKKAEGNR